VGNWLYHLPYMVRKMDHDWKFPRRDLNPIEDRWFPGKMDVAAVIGTICGVAVLDSGSEMHCVGSRSSFEPFTYGINCLRKSKLKPPYLIRELTDPAELNYDPRMDEYLCKARDDRIQYMRVLHKIAELYPELRDWDAKDVEIRLFQSSGPDLRVLN